MLTRSKSLSDLIALYSFILGHTLNLLVMWQRGLRLIDSLIVPLQILSLIFLFTSIIFLLKKHGKHFFSIRSLRIKLNSLLILFVMMLFVGAIRYSEIYTRFPKEGLRALLFDLTVLAYIVSPLVLMLFKKDGLIKFLIFYTSIIIVTLATTIEYLNLSVAVETEYRYFIYSSLIEDGIRSIASFQEGMVSVLIVIAAMISSLTRNLPIILTFASIAVSWGTVCMLYYSRRSSLVELIILLILLLFILIRYLDFSSLRIALILMLRFFPPISISILLGYLFIQYQTVNINIGIGINDSLILLGRVIDRFTESASNLEEFDRFYEFKKMIDQLNFVEIFFTGRGLGSLINGMGNTDVPAIHVGYGNLILKGGFPFLMFVNLSLIHNFLVACRYTKFFQSNFVFFISIFTLYRLILTPTWGLNVSGWFLGLAIFAPEIFIFGRVQRLRDL